MTAGQRGRPTHRALRYDKKSGGTVLVPCYIITRGIRRVDNQTVDEYVIVRDADTGIDRRTIPEYVIPISERNPA